MKVGLVLSCEHASAAVPRPYLGVFRGAERALQSHRGSDLGARILARQLAAELGTPLVEARATRLLADTNRSLRHPRLFSEWSRRLDDSARQRVLARYWQPYRDEVERTVRQLTATRALTVHVAVHTFTPNWRGARRRADVALLYDPARPAERQFVQRWFAALAELRPDLALRRNYPYRGTADGLTKTLRQTFGPDLYVGLELEVSQRFPTGDRLAWRRVREALCNSLRRALAAGGED